MSIAWKSAGGGDGGFDGFTGSPATSPGACEVRWNASRPANGGGVAPSFTPGALVTAATVSPAVDEGV
uniref:Uncharacterized protein n=1 Tax=Streptomyces griseochromogenes TaxID=68214 RepID=M1GWA4_9ACTN|nr:hypothetical protein EX-BLS-4 [Streptomyces griseochromogenes]